MRPVAIQRPDWRGALSRLKRLDCFVVPRGGTPRNDKFERAPNVSQV